MRKSQKMAFSIFAGLLLFCSFLMVASNFLDPTARATVLGISSDGFKTSLGALIGSLTSLFGDKR